MFYLSLVVFNGLEIHIDDVDRLIKDRRWLMGVLWPMWHLSGQNSLAWVDGMEVEAVDEVESHLLPPPYLLGGTHHFRKALYIEVLVMKF